MPAQLTEGQNYWDQLTKQLGIPHSSHQPRPLPRKPAFLTGFNEPAEWVESVPNVQPPPPTIPLSLAEISSLTFLSSTVGESSLWEQVDNGDKDNSEHQSPQQRLAWSQAVTTPPEENKQSMKSGISQHPGKSVVSIPDIHPVSQTGLPVCWQPASDPSLWAQCSQNKPLLLSSSAFDHAPHTGVPCPQLNGIKMAPRQIGKGPGGEVSLTDPGIQREMLHMRDTLRMALELKTQQR